MADPLIRSAPLAVLDVETTGLAHDSEVVEIAVVHTTMDLDADCMVVLHQRIRPRLPISPETTKIHGISDADVADCPEWGAVCYELAKALEGRTVLAYNAPYDWGRVRFEQDRVSATTPAWPWLDPLVWRKATDKYGKASLVEVARGYGIQVDAHGAAGDALTTAMVAPMVLRDLVRSGGLRWGLTIADVLAWQSRAGVALEADMARYLRSKGRAMDSWPWHTLSGVDLPADLAAPLPQPHAACRSCGAPIRWTVTKAGKKMPVNLDNEPHWATCPNANSHRGGA